MTRPRSGNPLATRPQPVVRRSGEAAGRAPGPAAARSSHRRPVPLAAPTSPADASPTSRRTSESYATPQSRCTISVGSDISRCRRSATLSQPDPTSGALRKTQVLARPRSGLAVDVPRDKPGFRARALGLGLSAGPRAPITLNAGSMERVGRRIAPVGARKPWLSKRQAPDLCVANPARTSRRGRSPAGREQRGRTRRGRDRGASPGGRHGASLPGQGPCR